MKSNNAEPERDDPFQYALIDRILANPDGNFLAVPGGRIVLPAVFGFCSGVRRAVHKASVAVRDASEGQKIILLGELIHNPMVNEYFRQQGVKILEQDELELLKEHVTDSDRVIIPAFGAQGEVFSLLQNMGCDLVDCTCCDVRRLWAWSKRAVQDGAGVIIFGRKSHAETVVTKARIAGNGGYYIVLEDLEQTSMFADMIRSGDKDIRSAFTPAATNASSIEVFYHATQISQTTMLYDETLRLRAALKDVYSLRFSEVDTKPRLRFQPTVCRATQDRQNAAIELCSQGGCDMIIVAGGFGSSNTMHLYQLASSYAPAYLIEDADAILSTDIIIAWNDSLASGHKTEGYMPSKRPLQIGLLTGASTPDIVTGQIVERLSQLL